VHIVQVACYSPGVSTHRSCINEFFMLAILFVFNGVGSYQNIF